MPRGNRQQLPARVDTSGAVYCFTDQDVDTPSEIDTTVAVDTIGSAVENTTVQTAQEILQKSGVSEGFCLDVDCGDGTLALELARRSQLYVIGIESDHGAVAHARQKLSAAGLYGSRVTILEGTLQDGLLPQYFADLIVSAAQLDGSAATVDAELLGTLQRPESGVICIGSAGNIEARRRGPLPDAGVWTHQNANAANTLCSDDAMIRGPLEVAWYRDGVIEIPDRHAQGPAPLFNRGVLVVEGVHGLCGMDAYNGRTRWVYDIKDLLADWDGVHHDVGSRRCRWQFLSQR